MNNVRFRSSDATSRRIRVATCAVVWITLFNIKGESNAQEATQLSAEIQSTPVPIPLSPVDVFSNSPSDSIVPVSFTSTSAPQDFAVQHTDGGLTARNPESNRTREWEPSTDRLSNLTGSGTAPLSIADFLPRLVGVTVLVLVTCTVSLWLARRWLTGQGVKVLTAHSSRMSVIETLSIATHSQLHIVQIGEREFLAAVSSQGLQQLIALPPSFDDLIHVFDQQAAA
ncbi:MAG: flagellar biosynthetic protein FliO [Planctomycetaceae bacterium]|nr:flagellar biosynthetic protein FliO [Planctomycetaceae bacterium]MCA9112114.1 flagellar biosynthetic protein FliO [Planctomycetaceae bacterium]